MDERIGLIADHHDFDDQRDNAIRTFAELIKTLAGYDGSDDGTLVDVLADARIMIDHIVYLTYAEIDVSEKIEEKIRRQLERDGLV